MKKKKQMDRLKINIIQFIIGVCLLSVVYFYLNANPAERTSLLSGPQVLVHKVKIMYHKVFSKNGDYLAEKYKLLRSFNEFVTTAETTQCLNPGPFEKLKTKQKKLKNMSVEKYVQNRKKYLDFASKYSRIMKENCKK